VQNTGIEAEAFTAGPADRIGAHEATAAEITGEALDRMARSMPGFAPRDGQRRMALEIARALSAPNPVRIAAIESQTGTGKTIAYLLGAIPAAMAAKKKLVVATATAALQEQLLARELPALVRHAGLPIKAMVAKGRGRYVCPVRLERLASDHHDQIALFGADDEHRQGGADEADRRAWRDQAQRWQASLRAGEWDGCRDALAEEPDARLWSEVTSTSRTCTAAKCPMQRSCPFYRARWALDGADLIVANHDLVLADLALGGGAVLPDPEETIYIFDEGHQLPEKAVSHGAASVGLRGLRDLGTRIPRALAGLPQPIERPELGGTLDALGSAIGALERLVADLPLEDTRDGNARYRWPHGIVDAAVIAEVAALGAALADLGTALDAVLEALESVADGNPGLKPACDAALPQVGSLIDRLDGGLALVGLFVEQTPPSAPPVARWVECADDRIRLHAAPVSAAGLLRGQLWTRCFGAVVTSATLTSLNRWGRFTAKAGLPEGTRYLRLASPFDYRRAALVIPWMMHEGNRSEEHTEEIARLIPELLKAHPVATLCLFTSRAQLSRVRRNLPKRIAARVRCQGDLSRDALLAEHRAAVARGEPAVIFGLASFAEGIDLAGAACEHVIVAKLPFAPPDSPVEAARAEWIERQGRNAFMMLSVPDAAFKLTQACGRLLRTEQDAGRITILDRRLVSKRYGSVLLDALPGFRRIIEQEPGPAPVARAPRGAKAAPTRSLFATAPAAG